MISLFITFLLGLFCCSSIAFNKLDYTKEVEVRESHVKDSFNINNIYYEMLDTYNSDLFYRNLYAYLLEYDNSGDKWSYYDNTAKSVTFTTFSGTPSDFVITNSVTHTRWTYYYTFAVDSITISRSHSTASSTSFAFHVWDYAVKFNMRPDQWFDDNYTMKDVTINFQILNQFTDGSYYSDLNYLFVPSTIMGHRDTGAPITNLDWTKLNVIFNYDAIATFNFNKVLSLEYIDIQAYNDGYTQGFDDGKSTGYQTGYSQGLLDGADYDDIALTIFTGVIDIGLMPVNFFLRILDFEVFGINIAGFVSSLLTIAIVIIVIRLVTGKKE